MKPFLKTILLILAIIVILAVISGVYEDWLWFKDLGYESLFWTPFISKLLIQGINGTILFILIFITLLSGRHALTTFYNDKFLKKIRLVEEINPPAADSNQRKVIFSLLIFSVLISIVVSFIVGFTGWLDILSFLYSSPFHFTDPLFQKDLSFFIFKLPFFITIFNAFFSPIAIITFFTALFYMLTGVIKFHTPKIWKRNSVSISTTACQHLGILFTLLYALKGFGYLMDVYSLTYSQRGHVYGMGYTDIFASLPSLKILIACTAVCFFLAIGAIYARDARMLAVPIPLLLILSILLSGLYPSLIQSLVVIPNELQKEAPYIENEIRLTRFAYGLDKIEEREYPGDTEISSADLQDEVATLNNIRLNDPVSMRESYSQKQGFRFYYQFHDIDVDRYTINGEARQVLLSPREISLGDLDPNQTFINTRYKYTHGFGVVASFANGLTPKGLPALALSSIPPQSPYAEFGLTEPRIYYGELTNDWVVVNTKFKEFDYPQGADNAENSYQGKTGLGFTPLNKLMLSIHRATPRFYLSSEITPDSKILLYRNVLERVRKLAPFLKYDEDPYPVIDNGRIKWIIDAYTTTNKMPYSGLYPNSDFNYIRNSVKVIVDAYDGTVDFYAVDYDDPILETYMKIFPGVFKSISEMPYSLKAHLRYPETLFSIQSNMLAAFHMTNTKVFYNKEDSWSIAKEIYGSDPQEVEPYYVNMKLPGENNSEFVLMLPFTPASSETNARNHLISWLAARMDGEHYGELVLYKLPKNIEIDGPFQVESRIDQDPDISRQLALWNQRGSGVIRGNLLVLPIAGNFLYVEPVYLQSTTAGSIPEMQRVIVAYEGEIAMANTLEKALKDIFGRYSPSLPLPQEQSPLKPQDNSGDDPALEQADVNQILEQIKQIREMLDSLENQLTNLTNDESRHYDLSLDSEADEGQKQDSKPAQEKDEDAKILP